MILNIKARQETLISCLVSNGYRTVAGIAANCDLNERDVRNGLNRLKRKGLARVSEIGWIVCKARARR